MQQPKYKLRWQMFLYLVGNGKDPKIAVRNILEMGDRYFDREAIAHVENLPEAVANADGDYDYWDEHLKRIEPLLSQVAVSHDEAVQ